MIILNSKAMAGTTIYFGEEYVPKIMECFDLSAPPRIHYDGN